MKAIYVEQPGGPENLIYGDRPKPEVKPGEALVKIAVSGVNYIDIYYRTGLYKADLPFISGMEGAGTVEAVGDGVDDLEARRPRGLRHGPRILRRVCRGPSLATGQMPDGIDFTSAAAIMLQGMTAHYLTHSTFPLQSGQTCLVHAAAGGVGLLLIQIAKLIGATVIGTVGSEAKAQLAREAGADHVINYSEARVRNRGEADHGRTRGRRGVRLRRRVHLPRRAWIASVRGA